MKKITEPNWMKKMPGNARLDSREMLKLFGYAPKVNINVSKLVSRGSLPPPSGRLTHVPSRKFIWKVSEVRKVINSGN